jgi:Thioredoxin like C-terminal domain
VLLDGKPIPDADAGEDVSGGRLTVSQQRLYRLVTLPKVEDRTVTIKLAPGISAYAFTFG